MTLENIRVVGLERSIKAIKNSYNVGEINTFESDQLSLNNKEKAIAISLGQDDHELQSHDAWLAGVIVDFDLNKIIILEKDIQILITMLNTPFFTIAKTDVGFHINTNFRALKHFLTEYPEFKDFKKNILENIPNFKEFTCKKEKIKNGRS